MNVAVIDPSCFTMPYDHRLCEALVSQGCKVDFIGSRYLHSDWDYRTHYQKTNLFYNLTNSLYCNRPTGFLRRELKGFDHVMNMYNLTKYLKRTAPAIIHFQWIPFPLFDTVFIRKLRKVSPTILTIHDVDPYNAAASKLQIMYFNSALKEFDHFIVHTQSSYDDFTKNFKIQKNKVSIIPMGVFDDYFKKVTNKAGPKLAKQVILFFGLIKPYKGLDILIQAIAKLPKDILDKIILLVAGKARMDIKPLKTLAENLGIARNLHWRPEYIPEHEVGDILKTATVFVLSHKYFEAQSAVLMSMLPFGKPIVATKVGAFTEVLTDGQHGYLIEPNDPVALANALEKLLIDPKKIEVMGKNVKKLADEVLSWNLIAQKTISLYQKILHG